MFIKSFKRKSSVTSTFNKKTLSKQFKSEVPSYGPHSEKMQVNKRLVLLSAFTAFIAAVSSSLYQQNNGVHKTQKNSLGTSDLKLKIDTAILCLNVSDDSNTKRNIDILLLSDECFNCSYYTSSSIDRHETTKCILVDSRWPLSIKLIPDPSTSDCTEVIQRYHYGEHGNYSMTFNIASDGKCTLDPVFQVTPPWNSNMPILFAFLILVGVAVLIMQSNTFYHKCIVNWDESTTQLVNDDLGNPQMTGFSAGVQQITTENDSVRPSRERLKSIDTFRGLCIVIMIFVNYKGGRYWFFKHSTWHGLTVADLVFPWFMFIMGINITLSINSLKRRSTPARKIIYKLIRRTVILFGLGIFVINQNTSWETTRVPGVLQRFAIAYFFAFLLQWLFHLTPAQLESKVRGGSEEDTDEPMPWWAPAKDVFMYWFQWICVLSIATTWLLITFLLPVPGCPTGYLGPGGLADQGMYADKTCVGGAAGYIDALVFGKTHIYGHPTCKNIYYPTYTKDEKVPYDPEGLLGSLNAIVIVMLGCQAGKIFMYYKSARQRIVRWLAWCLVLGIISISLCGASQNNGVLPVNKNIWTTSFVTTLSSMAFFLIALIYYITDVLSFWSGAPFDFVGMNSILLYVGHETLGGFIPFNWGLTDHATHAQWLTMNLLGVTYWVLIAYYCYKIKFFLKI